MFGALCAYLKRILVCGWRASKGEQNPLFGFCVLSPTQHPKEENPPGASGPSDRSSRGRPSLNDHTFTLLAVFPADSTNTSLSANLRDHRSRDLNTERRTITPFKHHHCQRVPRRKRARREKKLCGNLKLFEGKGQRWMEPKGQVTISEKLHVWIKEIKKNCKSDRLGRYYVLNNNVNKCWCQRISSFTFRRDKHRDC